MSYYQPQPTKNRTALWVGLAVLLLVLAVGAFLLGRSSGGAAPSGGPAASTAHPRRPASPPPRPQTAI